MLHVSTTHFWSFPSIENPLRNPLNFPMNSTKKLYRFPKRLLNWHPVAQVFDDESGPTESPAMLNSAFNDGIRATSTHV